MPIYEYMASGDGCAGCRDGFTLQRTISAPELKVCPLCKKPVRKVFSKFSTLTKTKVSFSDAKKAGFKVYKRLGKGEYERQ